jgi:carbon-monoxide dehydrogenase medium subunit
MNQIPPFEYCKAKSLKEALSFLKEKSGRVRIVAGGSDFLTKIKKGQIPADIVLDMSEVRKLRYIEEDRDMIRIGSLATHNDIANSKVIKEKAHVLADAESLIGSTEIRNRGTIGGNLCNASPAADTAPPLLVLESNLKIARDGHERIVSLTDFFLGPGKTVLAPDEILTEIQIPFPSKRGACFMKLGRRSMFTLSVVSAAASVSLDSDRFEAVRIALGSVAPLPFRARKTEGYLVGKKAIEKRIGEASKIIRDEVEPITDVRGTAEYRREMSVVLTRRTLIEATKEMKSRG